MNIIATKFLNDIKYLLGSALTAPNMYRQIKAAFPGSDVFKIFAEPVVLEGGRKVSWVSQYSGNAVNYNCLSDEDKSLAQDILSNDIGKLIAETKNFDDSSITDFIYKCIEIPGMEDVFIIDDDGKKHAVIIEWGFVNDVPGAEKGILTKLINIRKIPMKFQVVYNDDLSIAPFEDIIFEIGGKQLSGKSDEQGILVLEKIKENAFVKAWEATEKDKTAPQTYTCYENGTYKIKVTPKGDMVINVVDQNDKPLYDKEFTFEYDGNTIKAVSDADGRIMLQKVRNMVTVTAYQLNGEGVKENVNTFVFNRSSRNYKIVIFVEPEPVPVVEPPKVEEPKVRNMRFKVIDEKGAVIKSAKVTIKYDGIKKELLTDSDGYVELQDVPVGAVVEAKAVK